MVLVKRRSMIRAVTRGELVDRVDCRTQSLLGGRPGEWGWEKQRLSTGGSQKEDTWALV